MIVMGDARKEILNMLGLASPLPQPWPRPGCGGEEWKKDFQLGHLAGWWCVNYRIRQLMIMYRKART